MTASMKFGVKVWDRDMKSTDGGEFQILRHGDDNTLQIWVIDEVSGDQVKLLMGSNTALNLAADMCDQARRTPEWNKPYQAHVGMPPVLSETGTYDEEGSYDATRGAKAEGRGKVQLRRATGEATTMFVAHSLTTGAEAAIRFPGEVLMRAGGALAAEARRAGAGAQERW